jgi:hypothetical protein
MKGEETMSKKKNVNAEQFILAWMKVRQGGGEI